MPRSRAPKRRCHVTAGARRAGAGSSAGSPTSAGAGSVTRVARRVWLTALAPAPAWPRPGPPRCPASTAGARATARALRSRAAASRLRLRKQLIELALSVCQIAFDEASGGGEGCSSFARNEWHQARNASERAAQDRVLIEHRAQVWVCIGARRFAPLFEPSVELVASGGSDQAFASTKLATRSASAPQISVSQAGSNGSHKERRSHSARVLGPDSGARLRVA